MQLREFARDSSMARTETGGEIGQGCRQAPTRLVEDEGRRDGRERLDLSPGRYPIRTLLSIIRVLSSRWGGMASGRLALEERLPATAYD